MPDSIQNSDKRTQPEPQLDAKPEKPTGILPKNTQTWVISGLATVMVAVIALSGNGPKAKGPTAPVRQAAVIDPNAARIAEYRSRLDEETRKLEAEQAALNRAKQAAGIADQRTSAVAQPYAVGGGSAPVQQPNRTDDRESLKKQMEA